jgi:hypothetical protein
VVVVKKSSRWSTDFAEALCEFVDHVATSALMAR